MTTRGWGGRLAGIAHAAGLLALGRRLQTAGAIVLAYHDVGDDPDNHTSYYVSPGHFRRQLDLARQAGLSFVTLEEVTTGFLAGADVDGLAAVVFDDALAGVHHHAMPVLLELGVPAAVFAVSAELGKDPPWWPGAARVMTAAEIREMTDAGFSIASHTRTHRSLAGAERRALVDEVNGSRSELEDLTGRTVGLFAYPYGHFDRAARAAVQEAGYRAAYSFLNGRIVAGLDAYRLPRLNMWSDQGRARLAYHLARPARSWPDTQLDEVQGPEMFRT